MAKGWSPVWEFVKENPATLEGIVVGNFKCFSEVTHIPLGSGLNLFYGRNGAGKTAAMQAIRLVRQLFTTGELQHPFEFGRDLDASDLRELLPESDKPLILGVRVRVPGRFRAVHLHFMRTIDSLFQESSDPDDKPEDDVTLPLPPVRGEGVIQLEVQLQWSEERGAHCPVVALVTEPEPRRVLAALEPGVFTDDGPGDMEWSAPEVVLGPIEAYPGRLRGDFEATDQQAARELALAGYRVDPDLLAALPTGIGQLFLAEGDSDSEEGSGRVWRRQTHGPGIWGQLAWDSWQAGGPKSWGFARSGAECCALLGAKARDEVDEYYWLRWEVAWLFEAIVDGVEALMATESSNRWIGPTRPAPPEPLLAQAAGGREALDSWWQTLFAAESLVDAVNQWMRDHQGGDMSLSLENWQRTGRRGGRSQSGRKQLVMRDDTTGSEVGFRESGSGYYYLLPVLVHGLSKEAGMLLVEQPELHLHPAMQAALGDLFLQRAQQSGLTVVETHSEHVLLRVMRRLRESSGAPARGVESAGAVRPEHVTVVFFDRKSSGLAVRRIPLSEFGDLLAPWPGGFFQEDLEELL